MNLFYFKIPYVINSIDLLSYKIVIFFINLLFRLYPENEIIPVIIVGIPINTLIRIPGANIKPHHQIHEIGKVYKNDFFNKTNY